ncbi:uncharacterized protein TNCV_2885441 [Trichonephila clavipes]|nr:uncharacterized protein TNCV_2885441 [Trichonephila clavipes]
MAPGSRCMSGNTGDCRMSWTYRWAVMVTRIISRSDCVLWAMAPHIITPDVGAVCRCKRKAGLKRSLRDLHTRANTIVITAEIESGFGVLKTTWFHSAAVQFPRVQRHCKRRRRWVGVKGRAGKGCRDPKCSSARHLRMVRKNTGAPNEGATCVWMEANEAVGCVRAFLTMWWSFRRLLC